MRHSLVLNVALSFAVSVAAFVPLACGSSDGSEFGDGTDKTGDGNPTGSFTPNGGSVTSDPAQGDIDITTLRVDPPDAVVSLDLGKSATQSYRLFGKKVGGSEELDVTSRAVFYVPDNFLVGTFPLDGSPTLTTRLPATANDPPQRGGKLTVQASIANSDGVHQATTSLTVKLSATLDAPAPANNVPPDAASKFAGTVNAAQKPSIGYPNDGTMLPPNLRRLEVHWKPAAATDLFQITWTSATGKITYYAKCGGGAGFQASTCGFELDEAGYAYLAETNRGAGPVELRIRATDATGATYGESDPTIVQFAENRVDGGIYYWNVTNTAIMRFDFGAAGGNPEVFADHGACVGCHAISRDGTKMVASLNGQGGGQLVFTNDVTQVKQNDTGSFTKWNDAANHIQFASFAPDGSRFAAIYGDTNDLTERNKIHMHDGATGVRIPGESIALDFEPDHPDWAPNGSLIAMTRVGQHNTSQQMFKGSIWFTKKTSNLWGAPQQIVGEKTNGNRYNPNFVPDSSFLYFSESDCGGGDDCNGDADQTARTFAVKPEAGATPVYLANANKPGFGDGANTKLGDTFARSAPFKTPHRSGQLFWFTVASRRAVGLRTVGGAQHLWMFAVDPAKVLAGQDGSFTGFYLPFQDLSTSNHIGQWTEKIVGGSQPAPAPAPPPPPPPPGPPAPR